MPLDTLFRKKTYPWVAEPAWVPFIPESCIFLAWVCQRGVAVLHKRIIQSTKLRTTLLLRGVEDRFITGDYVKIFEKKLMRSLKPHLKLTIIPIRHLKSGDL